MYNVSTPWICHHALDGERLYRAACRLRHLDSHHRVLCRVNVRVVCGVLASVPELLILLSLRTQYGGEAMLEMKYEGHGGEWFGEANVGIREDMMEKEGVDESSCIGTVCVVGLRKMNKRMSIKKKDGCGRTGPVVSGGLF